MHEFKQRRSGPGCAECGSIRFNEEAHGHTCHGKIIDPDGTGPRCYGCGKRFTVGAPIAPRWR